MWSTTNLHISSLAQLSSFRLAFWVYCQCVANRFCVLVRCWALREFFFVYLQLVNFYRRFVLLWIFAFCFVLNCTCILLVFTIVLFCLGLRSVSLSCIYIRRRLWTLEIKTEHIQMFFRENESGLGFLRFACFCLPLLRLKHTWVVFVMFCLCWCKKECQKRLHQREYSLVPSEQCLSTLSKFVDFRKKCFLGIAVEFACLLVY